MAKGHPHLGRGEQGHIPRVIAWEVTRSCPLSCKHCRAAAQNTPYEGELTTDEARRMLASIATFAKPVLILTGGEPLLRPDVYEMAAYARDLGMRPVLATCGSLLTDEAARKLKAAGIATISISIDGADAESHDAFRGTDGAFAAALTGIETAQRAGIDVQINTTVTKDNVDELADILEIAVDSGAKVFNPFLLVPTGRGKELADREMSPSQYEQTLRWLARQQGCDDIGIRVTCAPHFQRIVREMGLEDAGIHGGGGCLGGKSFAFVSHRGKVQCCGFLDVEAGDLRDHGMDFRKVWEGSALFADLRDTGRYKGRCGGCEFVAVCGGCRARAYTILDDYLQEEPFCLHVPRKAIEKIDKEILSVVQANLPVQANPFDLREFGIEAGAAEVIERLRLLMDDGVVRRLGPIFDSYRLGYVSTLAAGAVRVGRLDEVAAAVSDLPGVTHNYSREHAYNLWFTLTAESEEALAEQIDDLSERTGVIFCRLPSERTFKIRVDFQLAEVSPLAKRPARPRSTRRPAPAELSEKDRAIIRRLQEGLPLTERPFAQIADELDIPEDVLLQIVNAWVDERIIRRFGAVVNHRKLGYSANGMAVFNVPPDRLDEVGQAVAQRREVSHCYQRPPMPGFDYNLYAMVHGQTVRQVQLVVDELVADLALNDHVILYSTVEFKKKSMAYFV